MAAEAGADVDSDDVQEDAFSKCGDGHRSTQPSSSSRSLRHSSQLSTNT
jgi:hypothetical protein